jgi:hypothetical protein
MISFFSLLCNQEKNVDMRNVERELPRHQKKKQKNVEGANKLKPKK